MDIKKDIGLDSDQLKLLCLMAYLGDNPGDYALKQLYGRNHLAAKRNLDILDRAKVTKGGRVAPDVYFDVVGFALDSYDIPTWAEKAHQFRTETASWLWDVGSALHNEDAIQLRRITRPSFLRADLGEYIGETLLTSDGPQSLVRLLTGEEILASIKRMLRVRFAEGTLTEEFWQNLTRYADTSQHITDEVYDMLSAYHFFQFGDWPQERKCYYPTIWSLGADAIRALYAGRTDEAYNMFQEALHKHDVKSEQKGMFSDPVLGWFYCITLYLSTVKPSSAGSRRIQDSIGVMRNNRHYLYSSILAPARILFTYVASEEEVCANYVESEVGKLLEQRCVTETKAFCCILLNFFKCMDLGGIKDKYSLSVPPSAAILQNELSPYLPVPADKKAELEGFFGGAGMTGKIHRRDKWEIIFFRYSGKGCGKEKPI